MKAIIIGATGATGKYLVNELINDTQFEEIIALVRRPSFQPQSKLKEVVIDFNQLQNYKEVMTADVAFSVMGTTLKDAGSKEAQWKVDFEYQCQFAEICSEMNVKTFVLLSAIGASPTSSIFYTRMKGELEVAIQQFNFEKVLIFQPASLIRPNTTRFGEKVMTALVGGINGLGLFKKYQVIHVKDLAKALKEGAKNASNGVHYFNVKSIKKLFNA
ncbi:NAD(P)H-binding protein [Faecalibacter rhinopitheci]|uniref:NAD(P)H-binding protein n=1 Tax=Faecalibacter rhinopitheci TaxID=2779678 RepID=A0A8J7K3C7_9FLAO|nr:NAD(P)H-binding protein [Faecalibacter rhinopitheci]MBF0595999.1 NAD(P)H-binding protein [Faecalibacter rhinopitheci]